MPCAADDCPEDATHEHRDPDEAADWRPVCEAHAEAAFSEGHDVRRVGPAEVA